MEFSPVGTALAQRVVERVDPALRVTRVARHAAGVKGEVWRIECAGGRIFAFKQYHAKFAEFADREIGFYRAAAESTLRDLPEIPRLLYVGDASEAHDHRFVLLSFAAGRSPRESDGEPDGGDYDAVYRRVGAVLRVLHDVTQPAFGVLPLPPAARNRSCAEFVVPRWQVTLDHWFARGGNRYLGWRVREHLAARESIWNACTRPALCHGDVHAGNLLVLRAAAGPARLGALLDFESSFAGDPLHDLAIAYVSAPGDRERRFAALLAGYGPLPADWRARFDAYVVSVLADRWTFLCRFGVRSALTPIERELIARTHSSRRRFVRSELRREFGRLFGERQASD